jgi:antitoxin component of MazEF toxin-antitoxin module
MIESIQKVIKVGSSAAVTIPAKTMKQQNISTGDEVKVTIEKIVPADKDVMQDYAKFKKQYGQALKNLASR